MEVKQDYRTNQKRIFQYILGTMGIVSVFSLIFIGTYLYLDYHNYLLSFERAQQSDLKIAQEKISSNIDSLKKLSLLTGKRIASSLGNVQRIQNILSSSHTLLPETELLKIQKITYKKLSHPNKLITRFGPLPIEPKVTPSDTPHENNPLIFFDQNGVNSKTWIFDQEGHLDGILEMEVPLSYFKNKLNIGSTLSFVPDKTHVFLQKDPLPFYGKLPDSFWEYGIKNRGHFAVFLLFMFFSLFVIAVSSHYLLHQIKKNYK